MYFIGFGLFVKKNKLGIENLDYKMEHDLVDSHFWLITKIDLIPVLLLQVI